MSWASKLDKHHDITKSLWRPKTTRSCRPSSKGPNCYKIMPFTSKNFSATCKRLSQSFLGSKLGRIGRFTLTICSSNPSRPRTMFKISKTLTFTKTSNEVKFNQICAHCQFPASLCKTHTMLQVGLSTGATLQGHFVHLCVVRTTLFTYVWLGTRNRLLTWNWSATVRRWSSSVLWFLPLRGHGSCCSQPWLDENHN